MFFLSLTILFFRCSILKACFTAVFPSLIRLQQSRGSAGFQRELDVSDKMDSPVSSGKDVLFLARVA